MSPVAPSGRRPRPVCVSGPSGGGKSTLLKRAFAQFPDAFAFSVSHTTRGPRAGERDSVDYHFVSGEHMQSMIDGGEFIEHAQFGGNMYGTSKSAVTDIQSTGRICVLDLELQGVRSLKQTDLNAKFVFVRPPSVDELERRLRARNTETDESLQKRLKHARDDMLAVEQEPTLFDHDVVNDQLDQAYIDFLDAIKEELEPFKANA